MADRQANRQSKDRRGGDSGTAADVGTAVAEREDGIDTPANGGGAVGAPARSLPVPSRRRRAARPAEDGADETQAADQVAVAAARPRQAYRLTVEGALWLLLLTAAALTRFWDLGDRALHHDESLHTWYSWLFAVGDQPYVHDPLMHGPFLFHANALVYLLFGATDATSRWLPALFGVLLVGLPWLLRGQRFLGRWGALACGVMLLISPAFLYYTRYIRHDPYTAAGSLLLLIAIFRYIERPQRRWLVIAGGTIAFLLANHEIIFAILLAFALVLWGTLLWGRLRPLVPLHLAAAGLGLFALFAQSVWWGPFPDIPWDRGGTDSLPPTPENQRAFYGELLTHPLVISMLVLGVVFVAAMIWSLSRLRDPARRDEGWLPSILGDPPAGTVERAVLNANADRTGLLAGLGVGLVIFAGLFSTWFTNLNGLATATFATDGTLLYWLGQHDQQRGTQPWFYFIIEAPQYELLAIALGGAGLVVTGLRTIRAARGGDGGPALFFRIFVAFWFLFLFAVLSWAGEKMPWLILHFTLPAILLGASVANEIIERYLARRARARLSAGVSFRWAGPALIGTLVILAVTWFLVAAGLTYGEYRQTDEGGWQRIVPESALADWWHLALPPAFALVGVIIAWRLMGMRRTAYAAVAALAVVLSLYQLHAAWRLNYLEGDTAVDTLIYNTTSPDVTQMMSDLTLFSGELTGGNDLEIWYDSCTSWPMQWYLRDFPNRRFSNTPPAGDEAPPVMIAKAGVSDCNSGFPAQIDGYTAQPYVLRWHEPEYDVYRRFAIAPEIPMGTSAWTSEDQDTGVGAIIQSIGSSVATQFTAEGEQRLFRLVMYRELPAGLNPYDYQLYVRNDLLPLYNGIRYGV